MYTFLFQREYCYGLKSVVKPSSRKSGHGYAIFSLTTLDPISVDFPSWWQNIDFQIRHTKYQNAYPIRNFNDMNNFAVRDQFHISNGLRDVWVEVCRLNSRIKYIPNNK